MRAWAVLIFGTILFTLLHPIKSFKTALRSSKDGWDRGKQRAKAEQRKEIIDAACKETDD